MNDIDFFKLCDEARKELPDSNWYSLDINGDFKRDYNDIYKTNIGKLFNRLTFEQKTEIVSSIKATNPNFIHPAYKDYNDIKRFGHEGSLVDELSKSYYGSYYRGHRQEIIDAGDIKVMSEYIVTDPYFLNKSEVEKLYNIRDDKGNSFLHLVVNKLPINKLKYFINNIPEEARVAALLAVNNDGKNIFDLVRYDFLKKESIAAYLPHHERETVIKAITKLSSAALLETASASPIQSNSQQSNNKESKVTVDLDRAALLETTSAAPIQSNSQQSNNKESKVTADLDSAALLENASASSIQSNSQQSNNKESKVTVDLDSAALLETASAASIQSNSQQSNNKESKVTADPDSISSAKLETASLASVHEETIAEIDTNIISANIIELIKSSSGLFSDTEKNWQTVETIVKNLTKSDRLFVVSKALKEVDNTST